jgi:indole-3-glycerol phosphate synthase
MAEDIYLKFRKAKEPELKLLKEKGEAELMRAALESLRLRALQGEPKPSFTKALREGFGKRGLSVVAELKMASPSKGDIRCDLSLEEASRMYEKADAISVLTEETYFKGSRAHLKPMSECGRPILRKDFVCHKFQILDTAATEASAILIIAGLSENLKTLESYISAANTFSLSPVVEARGAEELKMARDAGAEVILANARDFKTFTVNLSDNLRLIEEYPPGKEEIFIAASGVKEPEDLRLLRSAGYHAALIGTSLMESPSPERRLGEFLEGLKKDG